jgi:predicted PurR-regulated permease PerM
MNLNLSTATRWGLNALILLGMVLALYLGQTILIPTVIALLLAAMAWPSVLWLHQQGIPLPALALRPRFPWTWPCVRRLTVPWSVACAAVVGMLVLVALIIALGFSVAIPRVLQSLPNDDAKAQAFYSRIRDRIRQVSPVPIDPQYLPEKAKDSEAVKYIRGALDPNTSPFIVNALLRVASWGGNWLWQSILIMFLLLFLLLEGRMLTRRVVEIFGPSLEAQGKAVEALKDMANQIRNYLVWRTIINFGLALFLGVVYYFLGLSQAWTWALITAILWYVPYLGPILAGMPPVLDAFVSCDSPWVAVSILVFYVLFVTVEGYLIVPLVMGRSMELNATTVMLACLFWDLVWGTAGLFLAMPLMAGVKTICTHVPDWQPWANLMGTGDEPPAARETAPLLDEDLLGDTQVLTPEEMKEHRARAVGAPRGMKERG